MIEILRRISAYTILYDLKMDFTFFAKNLFVAVFAGGETGNDVQGLCLNG